MSFKSLEEKEAAIESSWEEYNAHMLRTGQWMTMQDYMYFLDNGEDEVYQEMDYVSATHGC